MNSESISPRLEVPDPKEAMDKILDGKRNTLKCALISKSDKQHQDMDLRVTQSIDDAAIRHNFGLGKLLGIDSQVKSIDYS